MQLKSLITNVVSSSPQPASVREFVYHCHRLASAYLRRKVASGRLNLNHFSLTLDDLALDSIADLFQRDEHDSFPRLNCFFSSVKFSSRGEEECSALTRQLVFSEVNRHLFRLYRESDPSLGKIIRNIKSAAKYSESFILERRGDEIWLCTPSEDRVSESRPMLSPEIAEIRLGSRLPANASLKNFLEALAEILHEENDYYPAFPLVGLALIIRSAFSRLQEDTAGLSGDEYTITSADLEHMIFSSVDSVRKRMRSSYVGKEKLDPQTYESHFLAIRDILVTQFVHDDGFDLTFFDHLRNHMEDLTAGEYQSRHRVYLEYFSKLARQELLDALRKELR